MIVERSPWWRSGVPAAIGLAVVLAGSDAPAQSAGPESEFISELGGDEELRAWREGEVLIAAGDYEAARLKFALAWTVWRFPDVLFKRALAEERSGHPVDAIASYGELLTLTEPETEYMHMLATFRSQAPSAIDAMRAQADRSLALLLRRVGDLEIDGPPGVRISVDGHAVSLRNGRVFVTAGAHLVVAIFGGKMHAVRVQCEAGSSKRVTLLGGADRR